MQCAFRPTMRNDYPHIHMHNGLQPQALTASKVNAPELGDQLQDRSSNVAAPYDDSQSVREIQLSLFFNHEPFAVRRRTC